jgi:carbon monoxide dehydrogenase subunit G
MAIEVDNSFRIPYSPGLAWHVLLEVEQIASCIPGASVEEFDGEVVTGRIKFKIGPISLVYRGTARFTQRDAEAKVMMVEALGRETRGSGTASAKRACLPEAGGVRDGHLRRHAYDDDPHRLGGPSSNAENRWRSAIS